MNPFILFGREHLSAIGLIILASIFIPVYVKKHVPEEKEYYIRLVLGILIWGQEISLNVYRVIYQEWDFSNSLPFHLCGFAILMLPVMLYKKSYALYEILYFWGLAGATQALLTPNIDVGIPHYRFFQFFVSHGLIVFTVMYATVVWNYLPTLRSLAKASVLTLFLLIPIGLINILTHGNYFFIAHKPETASVLDYFGPWPLYLLPMIGMGVIMFLVVYTPVGFLKRKRKKVLTLDKL
ncbi:TIGR02206 family membrane protein [Fidelibacter multiformis]|jgi:hypothetical integral membrane protein (TIGR02206 family)|uniref:YwaF family protein n=1 Tax=Fidelibacter multiformis TaxID=3377529 RepID=UPI0037DBFC87